jgi:polynucleotide 5'-hydroxyl-kinase GRC3/NOL9
MSPSPSGCRHASAAESSEAIDPRWAKVFDALAAEPGVTIFLGATDSGKTTSVRAAARYLIRRVPPPLAVVDADIGQASIGPPTTVGLALLRRRSDASHSAALPCHAMQFVGSTSPVGHLLQSVVAAGKVVEFARRRGAAAVLVDTTGLVDQQIGFQLKLGEIELLGARHVLALQREAELEPILSAVEGRPGLRIHRLPVPAAVRRRSPEERFRYRCGRFAAYFARGRQAALDPAGRLILAPATAPRLPPLVSPAFLAKPDLAGALLGLNDRSGRTIGVAIFEGLSRGERLRLFTPARALARVRVVQLGSLRVSRDGTELGRLG